jgi:sterol desaturase/sphingolipid hydroxylase (fatty acid hydroxylase superfamily)
MPLPFGLSETGLRFGVFATVLVVMALLELAAPKRRLVASKARRWSTNLGIVLIDSAIVRAMAALAIPLAAVAAAAYAQSRGWGLLNLLELPAWLEVALAVVVLDFAIWLQHLLSHKIGALWRLHRMHHADRDIDVTTAIRFHPIEIALSMLYKIAWVLVIGASPLAVLLFEVVLNACAMFNHANIALPRGLDRLVRIVLVTPDMHRVHHSVLRREHDSNYGFNLSVWDRIFGTYTPQPEKGHDGMTIGLADCQHDGPTQLRWSLLVPFRDRSRD